MLVGCLGLILVIIGITSNKALSEQRSSSSATVDTTKEIYYYDLEYLEFGSSGDEPKLLCTELAAEGECSFKKDICYEVRFQIPELMQEEIKNGSGEYDVEITYDGNAQDDKMGYIRFTLHNEKTDRTYIGQSAFGAEENIFLQHQTISDAISDNGQFISLILEVRSSQINGPFKTEFPNKLGNWCIKKIDTRAAE